MRILELWLMRAGSEDRTMWGLHGCTPSNPGEWKRLEFVYPSTLPEESTRYLV